MAAAMAAAYQAPKPTVIYNSFPSAERENIDHQTRDRKNLQSPSIHWFSQTIGPGRGLELLFQALPYLHLYAEIHLRGNYPKSSCQWLEPLIPQEWRDRVFIHPTVPNNELLSRIAEHDIGLALETSEIPSRNLTITNKVFQYLQAGLAVIATDTAGQREVFSQFPAIGQLISSKDPAFLAHALRKILSSPEKLANTQRAALVAAQQFFCWENQVDSLLNLVKLRN
jgi:glycosyltransferase involved in cell wall biosynthesis